ncbi:hypothetical protein HBI59_066270 [Parastagonospora nodorum]|nr:hypothetical protein HBI59_066270 [Parastagonospora nodorum]
MYLLDDHEIFGPGFSRLTFPVHWDILALFVIGQRTKSLIVISKILVILPKQKQEN